MKKIMILVLAGMLVLTACGSSNEGNDTTQPDAEVNTTQNNEQADTDADAEDKTVKGYVFEAGSVTIGVDMDMAPIAEALGEPASYFEAASCAFEGLDKTYTYGSYQITTYPQEDKDYISSILFKDDMVATKEGVSLFMTEQDMINAYGENSTEINGATVYEKDGMRLAFIVENGEIVSIEYQSTVLD